MANCSQMLYAEDLNHLKQLVTSLPQPLEFPLVVKPSEGQGSVGVSKVTNTQQLYDAVTGIENYAQKSGVKSGVIVETYIDGPEIDANFVMLDGEVLFSEVVDNFPCTADDEEDQQTDSFLERDMVYPERLYVLHTRLGFELKITYVGFGGDGWTWLWAFDRMFAARLIQWS
ncbi:putative D-alanine--D-alanine ligase B [Glarea lozoyensis 74030]|uniref:Putative D-alanine--D-alanine ligase B n=1 Tax=Glarea lozoyensis (strain ATCC 74030 / MF5533) TaxID=1104152 RepID=H0EN67_GLAL7|nr:putative D-alanine--D-alanine ligase B [Glarea lozoyensis 74030]